MDIKKAGFSDLNKILELQKICYQENAIRYNDDNIQPLTQTLDDLEKEFNEQLFLKIEKDSKIIGSVRAFSKNNICYIGKLIVHPEHQNMGHGTKLMKEIERRFDKVQKYELFTGFRDDKNIYLYKKLGYKIFKEKVINDNLKLVFMEKYNSTGMP
jgi:ribosomal protein S18 acetylase RimI-like enzyme